MNDRQIVEKLVELKRDHLGYSMSDKHMLIECVTSQEWRKVTRLAKQMDIGVTIHAVGHIDAVKLIHNYKQYNITLDEAFGACVNQGLDVGMSLSFHKTKLDWMKQ